MHLCDRLTTYIYLTDKWYCLYCIRTRARYLQQVDKNMTKVCPTRFAMVSSGVWIRLNQLIYCVYLPRQVKNTCFLSLKFKKKKKRSDTVNRMFCHVPWSKWYYMLTGWFHVFCGLCNYRWCILVPGRLLPGHDHLSTGRRTEQTSTASRSQPHIGQFFKLYI